MFYIISKKRNTIHSEPSRRSWQSNMYKSAAAAKAGITRTMKYYQAAIDEVAEVVAEGKPEYHARRYNAFRDATDTALGRTHLFDINNSLELAKVSNTHSLGQVLYTDYIHVFQISGMILLVAMIGAIVLTFRKRVGVKTQSYIKQISRERSDGVSVLNVESNKGVKIDD